FPAAAAIATRANANEKKSGRRVERRRWSVRLDAVAAAVAILLSCGTAAMFAIRARTAEAVISGVEVAAVDLHHAIAGARHRDFGRIVQADFGPRRGIPAYVVEIENARSVDKVVVDPDTGRVLKIKPLKTSSGAADDPSVSTGEPLVLAIH